MTIRKILFGTGVAFSIVGVAFAGERSRGTSGDAVSVGTAEAVAPVFQEVAPGVAKMSVGGLEVTASADGVVDLKDVLAQYGTIEKFQFVHEVSSSPMTKAADGAAIFANGAVGTIKEFLGSDSTFVQEITTAAEYKEQMMWTELGSGPEAVLAFADGAVYMDQNASPSLATLHAQTVPYTTSGDDKVFVDGAVILAE